MHINSKTPVSWKVWRLRGMTLNNFLINKYLCWEFQLPTYLNIKHFRAFKAILIKNFPSWPTIVAPLFPHTENFLSLKRVEMAVCGMQSVDLTRDAIKISSIYFSYNINLMIQRNYCKSITSIHGILKLWRMRDISIESKIVAFKTLAISKLVYLALLTVIPNNITGELAKIRKSFIWHDNSSPEIKHETLRMEFRAGSLKSVDIRVKFVSLQCSWVKKTI